ncbi:MAG TPA: NAD(P)-dependent oxidoreductase [Acidimicrobiales bacterium]|nr:NAD(P)-dependent oxidoreductase [Acidimicrobiales bacterium]
MTSIEQDRRAKLRIAVLGTGTMGAAIGRRVLGTDMAVHVWSRRRDATVNLVDLGATAHGEAADAAANSDVVITMLPTAQAIAEVMFGAHALEAMPPGAIWLQMATIGVEPTEQLARRTRSERPDISFVDAPVSGSRAPAEAGQLLILASGPERAAQLLEPLLSVLGRETLWLGDAGNGSRMKLVLNTLLAFQTEAAAEAAAVAEKLGVATSSLFTALADNPLASPYAMAKLTRMVDGDYRADFSLDWALKDLDLVASAVGTEVAPVAAAIAARWRDLVHNGSSGLDVAAARKGLGSS